MSRLLLTLPLLLLTLTLTRAADKQDDKLVAFFKDHLAKEFKDRPLEATRLGNHDFDHLLDDVSPKARAGWVTRYQQTLADLPKKVAYKQLSRPAQIDYEILKHHL